MPRGAEAPRCAKFGESMSPDRIFPKSSLASAFFGSHSYKDSAQKSPSDPINFSLMWPEEPVVLVSAQRGSPRPS